MSEIVRSAARVLDLLEFFAGIKHGVSLAGVSNAFSLPKSSALGLLRTLCSRGYLRRDSQGLYSLNDAFRSNGFGWGGSQLMRLLAMALPVMDSLSERLGETMSFGALTDNTHVRLLMQSLSTQPVRYEATVGQELPLHCTAMGRVILSTLPRAERDGLLAQQSLTSFTPFTLTDLDKIQEQIDRAMTQGYCVVMEEFDRGGTGFAVPVRDSQGRAIAAINASCISARFEDKRAEITQALLSEVAQLESQFQLPAIAES